jgi:hypothetical protein
MYPKLDRFALAVTLLVAALLPANARAITVDGQLDPSYALLSTQTTQTSAGDDLQGLMGFGNGSELDAAYGLVDSGTLYLFLTGNLKDTICGSQACTDADLLEIFIDSQTGGQTRLLQDSPNGFPFTGLTFDAGFAPDYWIEYFDGGALINSFSRNAYFELLPTGGGGASSYLGSGSNAGAPGTLSGGANPFGIQATIDNRNTAGVGSGCAGASGAGVTTGVELAIPLAAIGNPTGCIKLSVLIHQPSSGTVTNQVLGPVPPGTCALGPPAGVNFGSLAGTHYFTLCPGATPARSTTWGAVKTIYR